MLEVENLKKSYGSVEAVKGVTFSVKPGEIFALIGPNGAGKTTTLKSIMGFVHHEGEVKYRGKPLDDRTRTEELAFLPEEKRLYPSLKVKDMSWIAEELIPRFDVNRFKELILGFSLNEKSKISELSHGMRTLLYISLIFSKDASVYVLDEPTWGLDPVMRRKVFEIMNDLVLDGKSVLYTSHVLPEVEKIADEIAIMKSGEIVFHEELETLRRDYRIAFFRFEPEKHYRYIKKVEGGYLVLAREEEIEGPFESVVPANVEDTFDVVVGGLRT